MREANETAYYQMEAFHLNRDIKKLQMEKEEYLRLTYVLLKRLGRSVNITPEELARANPEAISITPCENMIGELIYEVKISRI